MKIQFTYMNNYRVYDYSQSQKLSIKTKILILLCIYFIVASLSYKLYRTIQSKTPNSMPRYMAIYK